MSNLRIGTRLLVGFGIIVLLTIFLGFFALRKHSALQTLTEQLDSRDYTVLYALNDINRIEEQMRATRELAILSLALRTQHLPAQPSAPLAAQWLQRSEEHTS